MDSLFSGLLFISLCCLASGQFGFLPFSSEERRQYDNFRETSLPTTNQMRHRFPEQRPNRHHQSSTRPDNSNNFYDQHPYENYQDNYGRNYRNWNKQAKHDRNRRPINQYRYNEEYPYYGNNQNPVRFPNNNPDYVIYEYQQFPKRQYPYMEIENNHGNRNPFVPGMYFPDHDKNGRPISLPPNNTKVPSTPPTIKPVHQETKSEFPNGPVENEFPSIDLPPEQYQPLLPSLKPIPAANPEVSHFGPVSTSEKAPFPPFKTPSEQEQPELAPLQPKPAYPETKPGFPIGSVENEFPPIDLPPEQYQPLLPQLMPIPAAKPELSPVRPVAFPPFKAPSKQEPEPELVPLQPIPEVHPEQSPFRPVPNSDTKSEFPQSTPKSPLQIPTLSPVQTTLPPQPLTPVPASASRDNFNFGSAGLFKDTCETVDGEIGSCISIYDCAPYVALLQESRSNPAVVQVLRKAHCGFEGNDPKVCCPRPGIPTAPPPTPPSEAPATEAPPTEGTGKAISGDLLSVLPEPPVCGVSNASLSRVVGGINANLADFPWMAILGYMDRRTQSTRWLCGGSLISHKLVLTAAHCIHGREIDLHVVRLGELDLAREDDGAKPIDVIIKAKIKHENYNPKAFTDDIGILVLMKDVQFTDMIRPICIPRAAELRARSFENYNPIIAGWGDTEFRGPAATHLQALQLPVVSNDFCKQAYSAYKAQVIDERVLCAGYKKGGKDACQGDSGGPLMQPIWNSVDYSTYFYQIGVVSYGKKCAEAGFPGVYTRVTNFVPWIEKTASGVA